MKNLLNLSVAIITKNEQEMIAGCLESVSWANDIIVIDAQSSDKTVDIAKKYTKRVFVKKWTGFANQKNFAIQKAQHDWILVLDADERVSGSLHQEISNVLGSQPNLQAFDMPLINYFLGKRMNYGGWQYDKVTRLIKKNIRYADQQIHEYLDITGPTGHLSSPLYHFSHRDISSNLLKTKQYAELEAHYHYIRNSPQVSEWTLCKGVLQHFWQRYVQHKGYKDGMEGFVEAMYQAFSYVFIIQAMLWEKQRGKTSKQLYAALDEKLKNSRFTLET